MRNLERIGNFTSSEIGKLMSNGKSKDSIGSPALKYIKQKKIERLTKTQINKEVDFFNGAWGHLCEQFVYSKILGINYELKSKVTLKHPKFDYWCGSPDLVSKRENMIADIKCPTTLESFYDLVNGESIESVRENHSSGDIYFWQLVSNAIITGANQAELIVFFPYKNQLNEIREFADGIPEYDFMRFNKYAEDEYLPHMADDSGLQNIYTIKFDVTEEMKRELTERVIMCEKLLHE